LRVQKLEQVRAASRLQARPPEAHPWRHGCLNEKRELARIEAARAARVSRRMEKVAAEVEALEPVERDAHADATLVADVVRVAAGSRGIVLDEG